MMGGWIEGWMDELKSNGDVWVDGQYDRMVAWMDRNEDVWMD